MWRSAFVAALSLCLVPSVSGCLFQHFAPTERLQDQAYQHADETRWGRIDLASMRVGAQYRTEFLQTHADWGQRIQIADVDLTGISMDQDEQGARSVVNVTWYDMEDMTVRATTLRQRWSRTGSVYFLAEEEVISGDPTLLATAEEATQ